MVLIKGCSLVLLKFRKIEVIRGLVRRERVVVGLRFIDINVNALIESDSIARIFDFEGRSYRHHFLEVDINVVDLICGDVEIIDVDRSIDSIVVV